MDRRTMFPILNDEMIRAIPWDVISPHEAQARENHAQSLRGLASRGGLSIEEAYCILKDMRWPYDQKWHKPVVRVALMSMVAQFEAGRAAPQQGGE